MRRLIVYFLVNLSILFGLFFLFSPIAFATNLYFNQPDSNGELYMGPYAPLTDHNEIDYWTTDRVDYLPLQDTLEPTIFATDGATATTTTDQYVAKINLWISGPSNNISYKAWYACGDYNGIWSNSFDGSNLTDNPQKVSFIFPIDKRCNLKNSPILSFGIYNETGGDYPIGLNFLASNANPVPNAGVRHIYSYLDDYDVKTEIWTSDQNERNPVLIIPGVMGTDLYNNDNKLWANLGRMSLDNDDGFLDLLSFDPTLKPIDQSISAGDVLLNPITGQHFYDLLLQEFQSQGYIQSAGPEATLFTFPYDWRYGISGIFPNGVSTSDLLAQKIQDIMNQTGSDKVDIVAHSTGGLILKKYIMNHPSDHHVGKAVFVGVPNLGSVKAIKVFLQGDNFGVPFLNQAEMQFLAKNLPVVYDLAPSQQYFDKAGSFVEVSKPGIILKDIQNLDFSQTNDFLIQDHKLNNTALTNAQSLHSSEFDNFDIHSSGVDFYNIVGCKAPTIGKVKEFRSPESPEPLYGEPDEVSGDGTVSVLSADSLVTDDSHKFYAVKADHGKMPSADGIRQQIVNIISGSSLQVGNNILTQQQLADDPNKCKLKGRFLGIFSPVNISVKDQSGNFSGLAEDGSIQNDITGASFEVWGEHKFVFLPTDEGQTYDIKLTGTGTGTFTLEDQSIEGDAVVGTQSFVNLPVTTALSGTLSLGEEDVLDLDVNGDGTVDQSLKPGEEPPAQEPDQTPETPPAAQVTGGGGGYTYYAPEIAVPDISTPASTTTMPTLPETGQVLGTAIHGEGDLVVDETGTVYLILNSVKHPFTSAKRFLQLGYKFKNVTYVFPGDIQLMLGMPM